MINGCASNASNRVHLKMFYLDTNIEEEIIRKPLLNFPICSSQLLTRNHIKKKTTAKYHGVFIIRTFSILKTSNIYIEIICEITIKFPYAFISTFFEAILHHKCLIGSFNKFYNSLSL